MDSDTSASALRGSRRMRRSVLGASRRAVGRLRVASHFGGGRSGRDLGCTSTPPRANVGAPEKSSLGGAGCRTIPARSCPARTQDRTAQRTRAHQSKTTRGLHRARECGEGRQHRPRGCLALPRHAVRPRWPSLRTGVLRACTTIGKRAPRGFRAPVPGRGLSSSC
jgi:hypothetical protein